MAGTSIFREGGYSGLQFRICEVESILMAAGHPQIVEDRTKHVTRRAAETDDRCVQKIVEGILR
jgi:hypothetical protein